MRLERGKETPGGAAGSCDSGWSRGPDEGVGRTAVAGGPAHTQATGRRVCVLETGRPVGLEWEDGRSEW